MPAAAESPVELDEGKELVELSQHKLIFGGEKLLLFLEDFEVTGAAGDVAIGGDFDRGLIGLNGAGLLDAGFGVFFAGDECVGDFLESIEHRVLETQSHFIAKCFGASVFTHELATVENRASQIRGDVPGVGTARGKCRKFWADLAQECGETELREKIGDGDADLSVGGTQSLFGLKNIGPTFE